jgi:S-adenosylmethionine hydrolase
VILLFTDFGAEGPYLGQMEAVLRRQAPGVDIVNLLSNAPVGDPVRSGYLLAALVRNLPSDCTLLTVVDPGVGGDRLPVALLADGRWFVGPDNGLLNTVARQASQAEWRIIDWRPEELSASFHGRDLFAPIAARIARSDFAWPFRSYPGPDLSRWPDDLAEIVHIDHYGNAISGQRHSPYLNDRLLRVQGKRIPQAKTFCEVKEGETFWYGNSMGLIEIAVNRGRADLCLGLVPGVEIVFE